MNFNDIQVGMLCNSHKGSGRVTWIDAATQTVYMADIVDQHQIEVPFEEMYEDPQAHNHKDMYYSFHFE